MIDPEKGSNDFRVLSNARSQDDSLLRVAGKRKLSGGLRLWLAGLGCVAAIVAGVNIWAVRGAVELKIASLFDAPFIRTVDCDGENAGRHKPACGYLYAPVSSGESFKGLVRIPYIHFRSDAETGKKAETVVYIDGGPGSLTEANPSGVSAWSAFLDSDDGAWLSGHDLIVYSQRGLPDTLPKLECEEYPAYERTFYLFDPDYKPTSNEYIASLLASTETCRNQIAKAGLSPTDFTTADMLDDLSFLLQELGLNDVVLWGGSYGSYTALKYLDAGGARVKAAVLEGVLPPGIIQEQEYAGYFFSTLEEVWRACRAQVNCPLPLEFRETLFERLGLFRSSPITVPFQFADGEDDVSRIDAYMYLDLLWDALYENAGIARLPRLVLGETQAFEAQLPQLMEAWINYPSQLSIRCHDGSWPWLTPYTDYEDPHGAVAAWRSVWRASQHDLCGKWIRGTNTPAASPVVSTEVPVLMITGAWDVATPAPMMWKQLEHLPNGWAFEIEGRGHLVSDDPCVQKIIGNFLEDPATDPADECLSAMRTPVFR